MGRSHNCKTSGAPGWVISIARMEYPSKESWRLGVEKNLL
jgi:hypothetical protein